MKLRLAVVLSSLVAVAAAFAPVGTARADDPPAASPTAARDRFAGSYAYAGGQKQQDARDAAIEKATDSMFFVTRGVARGRLKDKTTIRGQVGFSFQGGNITHTATDLLTATSPENGASVPYKSGDDTVQLSQRITPENKLVQSFTASDGNRTNTYVLSADGKTMNMYVTLTSSKLPQPVSYVLTYIRR